MMNYIIPDCFKKFKCIAEKCSDNCCIGWEIDVDDESLEYYKSLDCDLGKKIIKNIDTSKDAHFILGCDDRCPFLNKENLCDIILNFGEEKIPEICKNHPRFFTWTYDRREMGIGLCCEEGARLLFESPDQLKIDVEYNLTDNLSDVLTYARETAVSILQNREFSIFSRLKNFLEFSKSIDQFLITEDVEGIRNIAQGFRIEDKTSNGRGDFKKIIDIFKSIDAINDEWSQYIAKIWKNADEINRKKNEFFEFYKGKMYEYEHLAVYYVSRYFLKAADDFDLLSKANFIVLNVLFEMIMDINSYIENRYVDRIKNSKFHSKEVEYSETNIARIEDMSYEEFDDFGTFLEDF